MKSSFLTLAFLFLFLSSASSQTYLAMVKPKGEDLWTYIDINGNYLVEPQFRVGYPFNSGGFALVRHETLDKYMLLDSLGNFKLFSTEITALKETEASELIGGLVGINVNTIESYSDGFLQVNVDGKWGYLDAEGVLACKPVFDEISVFKDGYGVVRKGIA